MLQLIGMLDSPYVRRVAISLHFLEIPFEHQAVSVFSTFEQFRAINPVVKAPSLICDDGEVLMDSTLILNYAERLATPKTLMPTSNKDYQHDLRIIGLALAACEKSVQIVYEHSLRPKEKYHQPWLDRVRGQLLAAYSALEIEMQKAKLSEIHAKTLSQAMITTTIAWQFSQMMLPEIILAENCVTLQKLSDQAEQRPEFLAFPPIGPGVQPTV